MATAVKKQEAKKAQAFPDLVVQLLLVLLPLLLYANTLSHGFVMDDRAVIAQNKFVQQGFAGIGSLLHTFYWKGYWDLNGGLYRPLSLVMFAIEWQLSPNNPFIHHLVQVILYAFTSLLLYKLLRKILTDYSPWLAVACTALFIAHPVHTEVVANIKSRDEVLCFLFFVLTALVLLHEGWTTTRKTVLASITFLCCLLAKEGGLLFLPVLGVLVMWKGKQSLQQAAVRLMPLAVVAIVWLAWHQYVVRFSGSVPAAYTYQDNSLLACNGWLNRFGTAWSMLGSYLVKCLWPYQLSYDYSFAEVPCVSFFSFRAFGVFIVVLALLFGAWHYRRQYTVPAVGVFFFFITMALTANLFFLIGATMADRFLYTPVLGFLVALCWLVFHEVERWPSEVFYNRPLFPLTILLLLFSVKTVSRNGDWRSDEKLLETDRRSAPNSARVHYNYASFVLNQPVTDETVKQNNLNEVIAELNKAVAIDSGYANIYLNLGVAYFRKKEYPMAVKQLNRAVRLNPTDKEAWHNFADALYYNQQYDSSAYYYQRCVANNFILKETYNTLGSAYFNLQQYNLARAAFESGLKRDTTNASLYLNYGNVLGVLNENDAAIASFQKAYSLNPSDKRALYYMATAYKLKGDMERATYYLNQYNAR